MPWWRYSLKIEIRLSLKETPVQQNKQNNEKNLQNGRNIFANHMLHKVLTYKIYKEMMPLNKKKSNKNCANKLNRNIFTEHIQMANRYIKSSLTSLTSREIMRYHLVCIRWLSSRTQVINDGEDVTTRNLWTAIGGNLNLSIQYRNSMTVPQLDPQMLCKKISKLITISGIRHLFITSSLWMHVRSVVCFYQENIEKMMEGQPHDYIKLCKILY